MMAPVPGDSLDLAVEARYRKALDYDGEDQTNGTLAFYERAIKRMPWSSPGNPPKYGNIILKKASLLRSESFERYSHAIRF